MSASLWDWPLASAEGLLTNEECSMLLEANIFDTDNDLLKTLPSAASKLESEAPLWEDTSATLYPPSPPEAKPTRAELANDLLQQLENQCKQENIFWTGLEEKVELPIFESIPHVGERVEPALLSYLAPAPPPQPTEELLREFESVYGAVELTHLTPPQSPPGPATQLLLTYAQQAQGVPFVPAPINVPVPAPAPAPAAASALPLVSPEQWPMINASVDFSAELQDVEELVRGHAAGLASPLPSGGSASTSPRSSPPSSPRSSTDDDWCVPSSRPKPYSRNVDDRRSRKKEQNKNAATRYRQKKKAEVEVLLNEEHSLRQRHTELGNKCSDLQREIRYLKGLMRDLFKAKGLIK